MTVSLIPTFETKKFPSRLILFHGPIKTADKSLIALSFRRRTKLKGKRKRDVGAKKTDEEKSRLVGGETFSLVKYATVKIMPARTVYCVTWA